MPLKILHVLNHSVPHTDGYCVRSENIVRFQRELGWEPVVVTSPHQEPTPEKPVEVIDGIRYYRSAPSNARRYPYLHQAAAVLQLARTIRRIIRIERPDLVHAHSPALWGLSAYLATQGNGLPFVYEMRSFWQGSHPDNPLGTTLPLKYRLGRRLETFVGQRANAVAAISAPLRDELARRGIPQPKLFVTPNGVNPDRFPPANRDAELASAQGIGGARVVGYLGSLSPWEGLEDLVRAAAIVSASAPDTIFLIVGGGQEEHTIRDLIQQLRLSPGVRAIGPIPHNDVCRFYSLMDIVVYPRRRNFITEHVTPLKPLEAMCMKKAILTSDVRGLTELLPQDHAIRFCAGDVRDLASQCLLLLRDTPLRARLGEQCRARVLRQHAWSSVILQYQQLYDYACKQPPKTQ